MSKIRLPQNKQTLIAIIIGIGMIALIILNIWILIPKVIKVYEKDSSLTNQQLIDKEVVNQAMELLTH